MAPRDRDEVWNVVDRKGDPVRIPGCDDWLCTKCTAKLPDTSMHYWARQHLDTCQKCKSKQPNKPIRCHQIKVSRATAAAGAPKTAAPKAAAAGGGGAVADTKQVRDLRRELAASKKEAADAKTARDAAMAKVAEAEEDDEFQDADEGDDDPEKSKEEWQNELDDLKAEVADNRKKVKAAKSKAQKEKLELSIEAGTARMLELQGFLFSAQNPQ